MKFEFDQVVKVWCEWDIGLEDSVFEDMEAAEAYTREALVNCGIDDDFQSLKDDGLVTMEWIHLVSGQ